ncbi:MAG TPA: hypothetical protein VGW36_09245 [Pyrinomonadaceae bacterium]|nr:hypothetical protein [Pyrinomonadaceae bacterium]
MNRLPFLIGTLVAKSLVNQTGQLKRRLKRRGGRNVSKKLLTLLAVGMLALVGAGCNTTDNNANANLAAAATTVREGADNSEITTTTDASGVKTETRVFRNNPRVQRVVVTTTRDGRRTVRVYSPTGTERAVDNIGDALEETGDAIASAAGWTADKGEDAAKEIADKSEDAAKEIGDKAEDVGDQTVKGAKKVGRGAKKVGGKIKDAVTP